MRAFQAVSVILYAPQKIVLKMAALHLVLIVATFLSVLRDSGRRLFAMSKWP